MIADLHCHYPMHLLPEAHHPHRMAEDLWQQIEDEADRDAVCIAARVANNVDWKSGWRVTFDNLVRGGARIVCSVLHWPAGEWRLGAAPAPTSFGHLQGLLCQVEADLRKQDPTGARHFIAKRGVGIGDDTRVAFVHCVEGGFHLGPKKTDVDGQVKWLADHGVFYITLAHLFFRGVATSAPSIPPLSDAEYNLICPQTPGLGLTDLGKAVVKAMYRHRVLIDISHMRQEAIADTFELLTQCDKTAHADAADFPVLATHVGMRAANANSQTYNLSDDTVRKIVSRDGLIGLIMAQHQIGGTADPAASQARLKLHLDAIVKAGGTLASCCAIGSDLDGFIKPTLAGFQTPCDYPALEGWIRAAAGGDADAILHKNVRRALRKVF